MSTDGKRGAADAAGTKRDEMYKYDAGNCRNRCVCAFTCVQEQACVLEGNLGDALKEDQDQEELGAGNEWAGRDRYTEVVIAVVGDLNAAAASAAFERWWKDGTTRDRWRAGWMERTRSPCTNTRTYTHGHGQTRSRRVHRYTDSIVAGPVRPQSRQKHWLPLCPLGNSNKPQRCLLCLGTC